MLTTGVDVQTCKNVAIVRNIGSITEFKQIIGRGTRVREDYGKLYFNILDYTGAATRLFADPDFDGDPALVTTAEINEEGEETNVTVTEPEPLPELTEEEDSEPMPPGPIAIVDSPPRPPRKYYIDDHAVEIAGTVVFELDTDGRRLRPIKLTEYAAEKVRTIWRNPDDLRSLWMDGERRNEIVSELEGRGIELRSLAEAANQPDADPFDLLCHLAYQAPIRTRRDRAERLKDQPEAFLGKYGKEAREILTALLDKYADHGAEQLVLPDILEVPPISSYGNSVEIANLFGGAEQLRQAVNELQRQLYAA